MMNNDMNPESSGSISSGIVASGVAYRAMELELSDDGSSVVSDAEAEHPAHGKRRSSTVKQRKGSGNSVSQLSPSLGAGSAYHHPLGSPLSSYPVSIRQQLAIIKQMEQPNQAGTETSSTSSHSTTAVGMASPNAAGSSTHTTPKARRVAKVHKKNERGETALHVAARRGEHRLCKKLLQEGAMVNACDYAGWTPLHEACSHAHLKVAKVLISGGGNVNACSESGDTPLHDASSNGSEKLVWLLLKSGADRERRNAAGKRAIDVCPLECASLKQLLSFTSIPEQYASDIDTDSTPCSPLSSTSNQFESAGTVSTLSVTPPSSIVQQPQQSQQGASLSPSAGVNSPTTNINASEQSSGNNEKDTDFSTSIKDVHDVIEKQLSSRAGGVAHQNEEDDEESKDKEVASDSANSNSDKTKSDTAPSQTKSAQRSASPPITRRLVWREESNTSTDNKGSEHVLILSLANNDNEVDESRMVIVDDNNELMRRAVRTSRGVNNGTKRFTSQSPTTTSNTASPQKSAAGCFIADKRKQRGRRRARGGSATSATVTTSNMNSKDQSQQQIDDIYEFRSSPESDININKSVSDMTVASLSNREMSAPPAAKRQRISTAATTSSLQEELEIATEDLPSLGVVQGDEEQNEMSSTTSGCAVVIDEHGDDTSNNNKGVVSGRKVPPLRITLPRTPSEDGMVSSKGDGVTNTAEEAVVVSKDTQSNASTANEGSNQSTTVKKRGPKTHGNKKQFSPEESILKDFDDGAQRVTRSKYRQSSRQLRENSGTGSCDGIATGSSSNNISSTVTGISKRKQGGWRRTNTAATNLSSMANSVQDESNQGGDTNEQLQGEDENSNATTVESNEQSSETEERVPTPMVLMHKNTYEGYRGLRSMIEQRWIEAMAQPAPIVPEKPANYSSYMIVNGNYSTGDTDPCPQIKKEVDGDSVLLNNAKLRSLHDEQEKRRHKMEIAHKIERERLQMQAETEILRMATRKANPNRDSLSTVRILHEKEVFNTWFLHVKPPEKVILESCDVKQKFDRLAKLMRNRQQMESDALFAEQSFIWKNAVEKSGDSVKSLLKNNELVRRVAVVLLELNL